MLCPDEEAEGARIKLYRIPQETLPAQTVGGNLLAAATAETLPVHIAS